MLSELRLQWDNTPNIEIIQYYKEYTETIFNNYEK